jgi:hypothetical protein
VPVRTAVRPSPLEPADPGSPGVQFEAASALLFRPTAGFLVSRKNLRGPPVRKQ